MLQRYDGNKIVDLDGTQGLVINCRSLVTLICRLIYQLGELPKYNGGPSFLEVHTWTVTPSYPTHTLDAIDSKKYGNFRECSLPNRRIFLYESLQRETHSSTTQTHQILC